MPYHWIDPELFLEHAGVAIYHCYDDDSMVSTYWYTMEITDCNVDAPELEGCQFDVRDLPNLGLDPNDPNSHPAIIQNAIRKGLISRTAATRDASGAGPCQADQSEAPDLETLIAWEAEGGCEAIDGCWVEPDGICPHGCPSWLLELGLI